MYYNNLTLKSGLFSWSFKHKEDVIFRKSETELNQKIGFKFGYKIAGTCGSWLQWPPHRHTHNFSLWCRPVCYVMNSISLTLCRIAATIYTTFCNIKNIGILLNFCIYDFRMTFQTSYNYLPEHSNQLMEIQCVSLKIRIVLLNII